MDQCRPLRRVFRLMDPGAAGHWTTPNKIFEVNVAGTL
jgi:hypothetical protein